jgi:hypothetical protein
MISEARAVRLSRKERDVLEAPLPVAGDDTARFETSADRASVGGRAQYAEQRDYPTEKSLPRSKRYQKHWRASVGHARLPSLSMTHRQGRCYIVVTARTALKL